MKENIKQLNRDYQKTQKRNLTEGQEAPIKKVFSWHDNQVADQFFDALSDASCMYKLLVKRDGPDGQQYGKFDPETFELITLMAILHEVIELKLSIKGE